MRYNRFIATALLAAANFVCTTTGMRTETNAPTYADRYISDLDLIDRTYANWRRALPEYTAALTVFTRTDDQELVAYGHVALQQVADMGRQLVELKEALASYHHYYSLARELADNVRPDTEVRWFAELGTARDWAANLAYELLREEITLLEEFAVQSKKYCSKYARNGNALIAAYCEEDSENNN